MLRFTHNSKFICQMQSRLQLLHHHQQKTARNQDSAWLWVHIYTYEPCSLVMLVGTAFRKKNIYIYILELFSVHNFTNNFTHIHICNWSRPQKQIYSCVYIYIYIYVPHCRFVLKWFMSHAAKKVLHRFFFIQMSTMKN